jgi:hypothetical protein
MILYKALCGRIRIASRPIKSQRWYLRVLCDSIEPQRTLIESYRISSGSEAGSIRVRGTKQQGVAIGIRLYRGVRNKEKQGETRKNKEKQGKTRKKQGKQGKTRKHKDLVFPCFSLSGLLRVQPAGPVKAYATAFPQSTEKHSVKPDQSPWLIRSLSVWGRVETGRSRAAVGRRRSGCMSEDNV